MNTSTHPNPKGRLITGSVLLLLIVGIGVFLLYTGKKKNLEQEAKARERALAEGPTVKVAQVEQTAGGKELTYVGETVPFQNVSLYARISGYIDKIVVDKGDKVAAGQLLASLTSPEIDQQLKSAEADLENKKTILKRDESLLSKDYISKEDKEKTETDVRMGEANVKSLTEQQQYKNVLAPFNGTITARFVDAGTLIQNASNSQTSSQPVVTLSQLDKIRTYIYVEQKDAGFVKPGYPVTITLPENPKFRMNAVVTRSTAELDTHTRMMTVEIDLDNRKDSIIPGSYVQVHVQIPGTSRLSVPSEALVVRSTNYFVAVVNDSSKVHYRGISISENNGIKLMVTSGLKEGEKVALNLGESVVEGQKVRVVQ